MPTGIPRLHWQGAMIRTFLYQKQKMRYKIDLPGNFISVDAMSSLKSVIACFALFEATLMADERKKIIMRNVTV